MNATEKMRARIRALLNKTPGRGCTEAEALAAAEKAAQLMRDHGLTEAELSIEERSSRARGGIKTIKARLWPTIAWCTNTSAMLGADENGRHLVSFVGEAPGPDIAVYLRTVCERAADAALARFKATRPYTRRRTLRSRRAAAEQFSLGFVDRLRSRLREVFGPQVDEAARDRAARALAARHPEVERRPLRNVEVSARNWRSLLEGRQAADKVQLAHGVGGATPRQIGGGS